MTHQDDDLWDDVHFLQTLILDQRLEEFRKAVQQAIHQMKITLEARWAFVIPPEDIQATPEFERCKG